MAQPPGFMREKKEDDDGEPSPFQKVDKGVVLQEKRIFNESPLNWKKCYLLLTRILCLIVQGDKLTTAEATDLFFACTKLFQSKEVALRRMVYLVLKELTPLAGSVIMVIASLTKDMNSTVDVYRANSIRVLCKITDASILGQVERYLKRAVVDKDQSVASAALVSGFHLMQTSAFQEPVRRWFSEIQDAIKSKSTMVQYHALGLLHKIKQHDRLAVSKLVSAMIKSPIRSVYAHCLLIRYTKQVMDEDPSFNDQKAFYDYLESCSKHKSEIVMFEAARAICALKNVSSRELTQAITVLQSFLSSNKQTVRFSAVRTLNKVAQLYPLAVTACNSDLENLISDPNRSIGTLAIATLLKTGSEYSVDRLMKQISGFIGDITDEFKMVVDSIRTLCLKFPQKHRLFMNFLSGILRDEGGLDFKRAIVETMIIVISQIPEAKENGLLHLCEFIEDCEFTQLLIRILHLLGTEGPTIQNPNKYIRFIYNRVILENAQVRAAAVSALAKFGIQVEGLRQNIIVLLKRCLSDSDDEVRDRATFYLEILENQPPASRELVVGGLGVPLGNLEASLLEYFKAPKDVPFDLSSVSKLEEAKPSKAAPGATSGSMAVSTGTDSRSGAAAKSDSQASPSVYLEQLQTLPFFSTLGAYFKSSRPIELTESETEYVVNCVKHIFADAIVLQYNCTNTLKEQELAKVHVKTDVSAVEGLTVAQILPAPVLKFEVQGQSYVVLKHAPGGYPLGTIKNTLKFIVKEVDPTSGEVEEEGFEDQYQLEDLEIATADYVSRSYCSNFAEEWELLKDVDQVEETYALSAVKTLQDAVKDIVDLLGMQPCDKTENVPANKAKHEIKLAGTFVDGTKVFVRALIKDDIQAARKVDTKFFVRSPNTVVSTIICQALA